MLLTSSVSVSVTAIGSDAEDDRPSCDSVGTGSTFNLLAALEDKVDADQQQRQKRPHALVSFDPDDNLPQDRARAPVPAQPNSLFARCSLAAALSACLVQTSAGVHT